MAMREFWIDTFFLLPGAMWLVCRRALAIPIGSGLLCRWLTPERLAARRTDLHRIANHS
jgi:hypothetical protein